MFMSQTGSFNIRSGGPYITICGSHSELLYSSRKGTAHGLYPSSCILKERDGVYTIFKHLVLASYYPYRKKMKSQKMVYYGAPHILMFCLLLPILLPYGSKRGGKCWV